ncbi:hypothetical protein [Flavobacterium helocola]|jgi:hypothetical protein|uniref:Uncharacterized protein n=1 Tax=Flavobacterium helocola TaxID=3139139 RepID=A0ABU9I4L4_9FLAO
MKLSLKKRTSVKSKRKSAGINLMPFFVWVSIFASAFTLFIVYKITVSERSFFSISLFALLSGVIIESYRISKDWKIVFFKFIGAYVFSFIAFLPKKNEVNYNIESHIEFWLQTIVIIYVVISAIFYKEKIVQKLTEGITLLLSLSLIYWVLDYGFINIDFIVVKILLIVGLLFAVYSISHSLFYMPLSRTSRLVLSIWSSIVVFAFALDNIFRVFTNKNIEDSEYFAEGLHIGIQYFLLGISAIYILQNYFFLTDLLPSKNGNYKKDLFHAKSEHIKRFSDSQVSRKNSLICILYCTCLYFFNGYYDLLPRHTMIWLVIFSFPVFVGLFNYIMSRSKVDSISQ